MTRVEISRAADADLAEILSYGTETFGQDRAETYVASFRTAFDLIARYPWRAPCMTRCVH
jgi:plasmid stabilization system protein ParE